MQHWTYNTHNKVSHYSDSRGVKQQFDYDSQGNEIYFKHTYKDNKKDYEQWQEYDNQGVKTSYKDSNGRLAIYYGKGTYSRGAYGDERFTIYDAQGNELYYKNLYGGFERRSKNKPQGNIVSYKYTDDREENGKPINDKEGNIIPLKSILNFKETVNMNRTELLQHSTLGFTNNLNPLHKKRAENTLNISMIYRNSNDKKGKVLTRKEFVIKYLKNNYIPFQKTYSMWSIKKEENLQKSEYLLKLQNNDNPNAYSSFTITKTEFDFANYILDNNILQNIDEILITEHEERQVKKEEIQAKKDLKLQVQKDYENWLEDAIYTYKDDEKQQIAENVCLNDNCVARSYVIKKLLVLIENISEDKCRDSLINLLHFRNTTSKKIFHSLTGIKLPKTDKGTRAILQNITPNDYKGTISCPLDLKKNEKVFYISQGKNNFEKAIGTPISDDLFCYSSNKDYFTVVHTQTGIAIAEHSDKQTAIDKALDIMTQDYAQKRINEILKDQGEVPVIIN